MTAASRVHQPVLTGRRRVGGLWFPSDWFDVETRQHLLLQAWRHGSAAYRFPAGDLLRWPEPVMLDCAALSGWPLQPAGRALASASLTPEELAGQPQADLWLVLGAELMGLRHADGELLDPSGWLSLKNVPFTDTWDLRAPPPEAAFIGIEPARDIRRVLGAKVAPASADAKAFLEALGKRDGAGTASGSPRPSSSQDSRDGPVTSHAPGGWAIASVVFGAIGLLRLLADPPAAPSPPPPPPLQAPAPAPSPAPAPLRTLPLQQPLPKQETYPGLSPGYPGNAGDPARRQDAALDFARQVPQSSADRNAPPALPGNAIAGGGRQTAFSDLATNPYGGATLPDERASGAAGAPGASAPRAPEPQADPMTPFLGVVAFAVGVLVAVLLLIWARRSRPRRRAAQRRRAVPSPAGAPVKAAGGGAGGALTGADGPSPEGAPSGLRERLRDRVVPQRWRAWLARMAMTSGVAKILGRQHAAYVRRMLAMFEDGNIEDALKHAIPLGQGQESLGQLLGRLGPRQDLSLSGARGAAVSVGIDASLEQHLRTLYRSVFTKLDREGRVDEAAYVLAELLQARGEALDYLERHDRCKQAAELAFGWDMPAALIIRLLALAGDWRRALLVARRDNAFAAAVTLLQNKSPDIVARLRREWAQSLVAQGRWLAAVDAIWPVAEARAEAQEWLDLAEQAGGSAAARALALRSQCLPDTLAARAEALRRIQCDPSMARERAAMAMQLLALTPPVSHVARSLAAALAGPLLADHEGGEGMLRPADLRGLVEFAADPVLSADMPSGSPSERRPQSLLGRGTPVRWQAPEAGLQPVLDAVPLLDGEFLVATGESGLLRLDARGRRIGKVDAPAHRIVAAHDGRSALGLARRGTMWRVSRIDLVRMSAHDLGHIAAQAFADQYDGLGWTVANGTRVQVFDTTSPKLDQVLWQVTDLPGPVVAIEASELGEAWLLDVGDGTFESWRYLLPRRALTHRETVGGMTDSTRLVPIAGMGVLSLTVYAHFSGSCQMRITPEQRGHWPSCPTPAPGHPARAALPWVALRSIRDLGNGSMTSGPTIDFALLQTGRVQASIEWPAEVLVSMRVFSSCWLLHDLQGRLAVVSLQNGWIDQLSVV